MLITRLKNNKKKGFTLVELIIVIAVIAILAVVMTTAFSGVIDDAIKSTVQSKMATFEQELVTKVSNHTSNSCSCGGNNDIWECPTIINFINDQKYTGYVVSESDLDDFYVTKDADANAVGATWIGDYSALAKNNGVVVLAEDGTLAYAYYCRGNKYYFHAKYSIANSDGAVMEGGTQADWGLYAAEISGITGALTTYDTGSTGFHAIAAD